MFRLYYEAKYPNITQYKKSVFSTKDEALINIEDWNNISGGRSEFTALMIEETEIYTFDE